MVRPLSENTLKILKGHQNGFRNIDIALELDLTEQAISKAIKTHYSKVLSGALDIDIIDFQLNSTKPNETKLNQTNSTKPKKIALTKDEQFLKESLEKGMDYILNYDSTKPNKTKLNQTNSTKPNEKIEIIIPGPTEKKRTRQKSFKIIKNSYFGSAELRKFYKDLFLHTIRESDAVVAKEIVHVLIKEYNIEV